MLTAKKYIYLFICFCTLFGCTNIEGTYVANHQLGYDTVKIFINNKYERKYHTRDKSQSYTDTGSWKTSKGRIDFYDWIDRNGINNFEGKGSIVFGTEISKSFFSNEIKLPINYDLEYYYVKVK
ncbi:MAG: hypothetical protein NTU43_06660 [Bacteroidetes bacterium]|nr:hypothetical protein [Bacteroidota bacterium]